MINEQWIPKYVKRLAFFDTIVGLDIVSNNTGEYVYDLVSREQDPLWQGVTQMFQEWVSLRIR